MKMVKLATLVTRWHISIYTTNIYYDLKDINVQIASALRVLPVQVGHHVLQRAVITRRKSPQNLLQIAHYVLL